MLFPLWFFPEIGLHGSLALCSVACLFEDAPSTSVAHYAPATPSVPFALSIGYFWRKTADIKIEWWRTNVRMKCQQMHGNPHLFGHIWTSMIFRGQQLCSPGSRWMVERQEARTGSLDLGSWWRPLRGRFRGWRDHWWGTTTAERLDLRGAIPARRGGALRVCRALSFTIVIYTLVI